MIRIVPGLLLLLITLAAPADLHACTCFIVRPVNDSTPPRSALEGDRVFVGTALEVRERSAGVRSSVDFLVESSWRGAMPDIVTVTWLSPCAYHVAGMRYLVVADVVDSDAAQLVSAPCGRGAELGRGVATNLLTELGPPTWLPEPFGQRRIDSDAILVGQTPPPGGDAVRLAIGFLSAETVVGRVLIADQEGQLLLRAPSPVFRLPEGLYQLRIEWADGATSQTYVSVRCLDGPLGRRCLNSYYLDQIRLPVE
jgi:hypothetical protein